ncbi:HlyD family secretion protein [Rhizobium wuzhouense]|uniref:Efflux RND transporter periplasmic adaptor subunit n=1 Tax=Rhizobium wuzhouense TaxID=1986026 RepID=A0ABX5NUI3_9HYPH|nr:HlyD family efflux transporter periplasmic adaptor subunit [Rhizobium wuzhouense]PYB74213.1 efflux RND transporter periplasmic adaptor subunit [Rhizobium wuzhouense]
MKLPRKNRYLAPLLAAGILTPLALWLTSEAPSAGEDVPKTDVGRPPILAAARGVVDVEGGLLKITAPRDGMVRSVKVAEMKRVRAGDILAELDSQQEQLAARISEEEALQAEAHFKLLQVKMKSLEKQVQRMQRAAVGEAVSDQALDDVLASRDSLAIELKVAESAAGVARSRKEMAQHEVELRTVRAPADGLIIRQFARVGEVVSAQAMSELFTLLPDGMKIVRAELPEQFLGDVQAGVPVEVVAEDRMAQAVPGSLDRISPVLMQSSNQVSGERNDVRTATSIVTIDQNAPFRIGQRVIVRVYK